MFGVTPAVNPKIALSTIFELTAKDGVVIIWSFGRKFKLRLSGICSALAAVILMRISATTPIANYALNLTIFSTKLTSEKSMNPNMVLLILLNYFFYGKYLSIGFVL